MKFISGETMTDWEKDEPIIELTEVVEDAPNPAGQWMETSSPTSPERKVAEPPGAPHRSLPDMEVEMRAVRQAMLARMEKWVAEEGVQILERVARELFPKIAADLIREEIEKLKAEAEEKE
jgi:hypothetical protein